MIDNKGDEHMSNIPYRHPHYTLRIATPTMDRLRYTAGRSGRSVNKEIGQLALTYIDAYKKTHGEIMLAAEGYELIRERSLQ